MSYEYEVYVDKSWMAGGSAASPADALGEADHYALMYANDGDVQVFFYTKQIISREDMEAAACASERLS